GPRPDGANEDLLDFGRLVIDVRAHEVRLDGVAVPMPAREFALLHLLAARSSSPGSGASMATRVPSRRTSAGCARRLRRTRPTRATSSRCGAWATASRGCGDEPRERADVAVAAVAGPGVG